MKNHKSEQRGRRPKPRVSLGKGVGPRGVNGPPNAGKAGKFGKPGSLKRGKSDPKRGKVEPLPMQPAPPLVLAELASKLAEEIEVKVIKEGVRADRLLSIALKERRDLTPADHRQVAGAVFSWFRWRGWIEPLRLPTIAERLLVCTLLDAPTVPPICRTLATKAGRDPRMLVAIGEAPDWPTRVSTLKRLLKNANFNGDPWRLFPEWFRDVLPTPPGDETPKRRFAALIWALQKKPTLWVRVQGRSEKEVWAELREAGITPWVHRRMTHAARVAEDVDVYHLPAFQRGELEIQDLASQCVGLICDPDPGERWWDACAGAGGKALHLASLMKGKGVVVATDTIERKLREISRRSKRSPFRNISPKVWDGKGAAGKASSFDGVLVDAPCSALGTWKRNPDARWGMRPDAVPRLAALQADILHAASLGVKPGGTLVYSVCTITPMETTDVIAEFLQNHPQFRLDPFPNPLDGELCDGRLTLWPGAQDGDAMYIARMIRVAKKKEPQSDKPKSAPKKED